MFVRHAAGITPHNMRSNTIKPKGIFELGGFLRVLIPNGLKDKPYILRHE